MQFSLSRFVPFLALMAIFSTGCQNSSSPSVVNVESKTPVVPEVESVPEAPKPVEEPARPVETQILGKGEQESCIPLKIEKSYAQSDCGEGLICAPSSTDLSQGTCRISCGTTENGKQRKVPENCPASRTCQVATSLAFDELGTYCLPQQAKRDAPCSAVTDKEACTNNRICAVSEVSKDELGQPVATSFICRDACPYGTKAADEACAKGETCIAYPYESTSQSNEKGEPVACTESKCRGDFSGCECDVENGFQCSALIPGVIAFCDRSAGICATPVSFASVADFDSGRFSGEKCNEIKGHAFCDNSAFLGLKNPGESMCFQISETTGDGFCFAFCSTPSLDQNGDGLLKGREVGQKFDCPANYMCSTELGRALGMVSPISDSKAPNGKKSCDPAKCEAGMPCPSECGVGDAECLSYERNGEFLNFCGAPFGNCELSMSF